MSTPATSGVRLAIASASMFLAASGAGISTAVVTDMRPAHDLAMSIPMLGLAFVLLVTYRRLNEALALKPWSVGRRIYVGFALLSMAGIGALSVLAPTLEGRWIARGVDIGRDARAHERVLRGVLRADCPGAIGIVDTWQPLTTGGAIAKKGVLLQLYGGFLAESASGEGAEPIHRRCLSAEEAFARVGEMVEIGTQEASVWQHVPVIGRAMDRYAQLILINQREWCVANEGSRCELLPDSPAATPTHSDAVKRETLADVPNNIDYIDYEGT